MTDNVSKISATITFDEPVPLEEAKQSLMEAIGDDACTYATDDEIGPIVRIEDPPHRPMSSRELIRWECENARVMGLIEELDAHTTELAALPMGRERIRGAMAMKDRLVGINDYLNDHRELADERAALHAVIGRILREAFIIDPNDLKDNPTEGPTQ